MSETKVAHGFVGTDRCAHIVQMTPRRLVRCDRPRSAHPGEEALYRHPETGDAVTREGLRGDGQGQSTYDLYASQPAPAGIAAPQEVSPATRRLLLKRREDLQREVENIGRALAGLPDIPAAGIAEEPGEEEIAEAVRKIDAAHEKLVALCGGERFRMSIPARPLEDHDLVIGDALRTARKALLFRVRSEGGGEKRSAIIPCCEGRCAYCKDCPVGCGHHVGQPAPSGEKGWQQGAEAMREAAAKWHEDQAASWSSQQELCLPSGDEEQRTRNAALAALGLVQRTYAQAIRALKVEDLK